MNTPTKPSAGALKAAETICQMVPCCNDPDHLTNIYRLKEINRIAVIINSESGLAEALDALRGMVGLVQLIQSTESPAQKHLVMSNHRFIEAQRVIAKAENPSADVQQVAPAGRWTKKGTV